MKSNLNKALQIILLPVMPFGGLIILGQIIIPIVGLMMLFERGISFATWLFVVVPIAAAATYLCHLYCKFMDGGYNRKT